MRSDKPAKSDVHDTSITQNGDITITEEEELNLFPSLNTKQERQQSLKSSKSIRLPSTGKKFSRQKRPPVGCLGKLATMNKMHNIYCCFYFY